MFKHKYLSVALVLVIASIGLVDAEDREWIKRHHVVEMDDINLGEYTHISTSDDLSPYVNRILYRDPLGVRLVIRATVDVLLENGDIVDIESSQYSVTSLDTGEQLILDLHGDGTMTASIGAVSLSYPDQFQLPQETKDDAQAFLQANASQSFQDALMRLARVGLQYAPILMDISASLQQLFFYELGAGNRSNYVTESEVVLDFDPQLTQPGQFEQQFGVAYFE